LSDASSDNLGMEGCPVPRITGSNSQEGRVEQEGEEDNEFNADLAKWRSLGESNPSFQIENRTG
jgi:hypothetical protein